MDKTQGQAMVPASGAGPDSADLERLAVITPGVTTQLQVDASVFWVYTLGKRWASMQHLLVLCLQDFCSLALETIKVCQPCPSHNIKQPPAANLGAL